MFKKGKLVRFRDHVDFDGVEHIENRVYTIKKVSKYKLNGDYIPGLDTTVDRLIMLEEIEGYFWSGFLELVEKPRYVNFLKKLKEIE